MKRDGATTQASLEVALELYRAGNLSPGQAAELAGVNRWEFADLVKQRGITTPYTEEMVKEDFANGCRH